MRRLQLVCALALISSLRWIVPRRFRARWIAEWRGELWHLWRVGSSQTAGDARSPSGVLSRSLSSIPHATALARQEWTPDMLLQDVRYAVRRLSSNPGFVLVAVLTIAIGVGANTAIFSVINSTLINPLPYPDADRIVYLWSLFPVSDFMVTPGGDDIRAWREQMTSFEEMEVWATKHVTLTGEGEPVDLVAALASERLFSFLGVQPSHGRGFTFEEARDDARVAVVSDGFWRRRLGERDDVLGHRLLLSGEPYEIIGVLPRAYVAHGMFLSSEIFLPLLGDEVGEGDSPVAVGRLKRGVTAQAANAEFEALAAHTTTDGEPDAATRVGHAMRPQEMVGDDFRTSLFTLQAAVGFVLLIACANVANLLLARGTAQQREMAVRAAMGAGRGRMLRQLLTENLLLAIAGGLLGYGLARLGVTVIMALRPESMHNLQTVRADPSLLWFALGVSVLTGVVFGLLPAMHGSRPDVLDQLKDATRAGTPSSRRVWVRNSFVVAEVALSIVLLVGAGLLLGSLGRLVSSDLGFDPHNVLALSLDLPEGRYPEAAGRPEVSRPLVERRAKAGGARIESMAVGS
jgi:putative ABC transport system permease protein